PPDRSFPEACERCAAMAMTSSTYISFPGNASEAFPFYQELFGGELEVQTYDAMPSLEGFPFTPPPGAVAHATLTAPGLSLAGGDGMAEGRSPLTSELYSFLLTFSPEDEARGSSATVADAGARSGMPVEQGPWGEMYGQVTDKF